MMRISKKSFSRLALLVTLVALVSGCSLVNGTTKASNLMTRSNTGSGLTGGSAGAPGPSSLNQSSSVPTADAVVGRILKGLPTVNPASGNFSKVLSQVQANLPSTPDPTKATGLEQIPLLVYAACNDVNPSTYSVNTGASVSANMAKLVAAGVSMVNLHTGNLAASGQTNSDVTAVFTKLVNDDIAAGASTAMSFVSVCMAANSFGVGMMGF